MAVSTWSWARILMEGSQLSGNCKQVVLLDSYGQDFEVYSLSRRSMRTGDVLSSVENGLHIQ